MFNDSTAFTMPVAPVGYGYGGNNCGSGMFGGDGGWWAILILFALFGGFGRGGFGGYGGGYGESPATNADIQRGFDTSNIVGKLDRLGDGICNLGYDQLAQMNTINQNVSQQGFNLSSAIAQLGYQNQQCCCNIERGIDSVNYNAAKNTCDIIQSQNAGVQRILDKLCETEIQNLRDKVAEQNGAIQSRDFQLSQLSQNSTLINTLRPYPVQAVPFCGFNNGFGFNGFGFNNFGLNNGCGCGCGC